MLINLTWDYINSEEYNSHSVNDTVDVAHQFCSWSMDWTMPRLQFRST